MKSAIPRDNLIGQIVETSPSAIAVVDIEGSIVFTNRQAENLFGAGKKEILNRKYNDKEWQITDFDGKPVPDEELPFRRIVDLKKSIFDMRHTIMKKDGSQAFLSINGTPWFDDDGNVAGAVFNINEVTHLKKLESFLKNSEKEKRIILDTISEHVVYQDLDHKIIWLNRAAAESVSCEREELIGQYCYRVWAGRGEVCEDCPVAKAMKTGIKQTIEKKTPDGNYWFITGYPVRKDSGEVTGGIEVTLNITERIKVEEKIRSSLEEKEVLLKEIHHRVKNNLQVISSLLSLQAYHIKDPALIRIFRESHNRIRAMALVHENLYRTKDLARIDFRDYIKNLVGNLYKFYGTRPHRVELIQNVSNVNLGVDVAVPCGLIVNELVSNALKYAFPDTFKGKGKIFLNLDRYSQDEYRFTVSDNGIGLPDDFDINNIDSLGLKLVKILTRNQLQGRLECKNNPGASFCIFFKPDCRSI